MNGYAAQKVLKPGNSDSQVGRQQITKPGSNIRGAPSQPIAFSQVKKSKSEVESDEIHRPNPSSRIIGKQNSKEAEEVANLPDHVGNQRK